MYYAHRRFFPFTEHFCIYKARVIDGKIRYIEDTVNITFFGLQINNHINCKNHTEEIILTLTGARYAK
jgi:hypothetical protein